MEVWVSEEVRQEMAKLHIIVQYRIYRTDITAVLLLLSDRGRMAPQ